MGALPTEPKETPYDNGRVRRLPIPRAVRTGCTFLVRVAADCGGPLGESDKQARMISVLEVTVQQLNVSSTSDQSSQPLQSQQVTCHSLNNSSVCSWSLAMTSPVNPSTPANMTRASSATMADGQRRCSRGSVTSSCGDSCETCRSDRIHGLGDIFEAIKLVCYAHCLAYMLPRRG